MVWEPGHWTWSGHSYAWVGGGYEVKEHGRHYGPYVPGQWLRGATGWTWVPAHFQ
jgi:hypothetical protein